MGTFDEEEYERREKMINAVDTAANYRWTDFEGHIEYVGDDSVAELFSRLKELREKR